MLIESVMPTGFGRQLLNVQAAKLKFLKIFLGYHSAEIMGFT